MVKDREKSRVCFFSGFVMRIMPRWPCATFECTRNRERERESLGGFGLCVHTTSSWCIIFLSSFATLWDKKESAVHNNGSMCRWLWGLCLRRCKRGAKILKYLFFFLCFLIFITVWWKLLFFINGWSALVYTSKCFLLHFYLHTKLNHSYLHFIGQMLNSLMNNNISTIFLGN